LAGKSAEDVAEGFIRIAVENMANAIKKISVQRGYDVQGYALNCFGGAGAQHACLIADTLGMKTVLHPPIRRRAVGLWHRPGQRLRQPPAGADQAA
jgi:5-oxoprolinase (ATP-hydrolysing)